MMDGDEVILAVGVSGILASGCAVAMLLFLHGHVLLPVLVSLAAGTAAATACYSHHFAWEPPLRTQLAEAVKELVRGARRREGA